MSSLFTIVLVIFLSSHFFIVVFYILRVGKQIKLVPTKACAFNPSVFLQPVAEESTSPHLRGGAFSYSSFNKHVSVPPPMAN